MGTPGNPAFPAVPPEVEGFRLIRFIARGGLGQVWEAVRMADQETVALKIALEDTPLDLAEKLGSEAEALRALRHPHIIRLLDVTETTAGLPVLVMEFVEGGSLAPRLPSQGFSFNETLRIFMAVLDAVEHAHGQGIIHLDLKPANILMGPDGAVKVADFGLARPVRDRLVVFSLTFSGAVAGTVEYLAPECYGPDYRPERSADIYALGILLYEMLTGSPPRGAWPPLSRIRRLDVRLDQLLEEVLHADPAERLSSVSKFRERLREIRSTRPRLAGTPLMNRAIRAGDLFWTILGLYLCAAGFCATLSQTNTPVPALLDLRFSSPGRLLQGFLAVWVLSIGIGIAWLWVLFRLWRFRHAPLRESLPSPFGLRLGTSPAAAAMVAAAQLFCSWLPPVFALVVVGQSFYWLGPHTPFWEECLVVTPWSTDEPVSPWLWDPVKFFDSGAYWLKQAKAGFAPGTLQVTDRTSFFIFGQPFLMVLSAVIAGTGMAATVLMAVWSWIRERRFLTAGVTVLMLCAGGWSLAATVRWDLGRRSRQSPAWDQDARGAWRMGYSRETLDRLVESGFGLKGGRFEMPPKFRRLFADKVNWLSQPGMDANRIRSWFHRDRETAARERRHMELISHAEHTVPTNPEKAMLLRWKFLRYRQPPGDSVIAERVRTEWTGRMYQDHKLRITKVTQGVTPWYGAEAHDLGAAEARTFVEAWLRALMKGDAGELEAFFHPMIRGERDLVPCGELLKVLLEAGEGAKSSQLILSPVFPAPEPLPGARWLLRAPIIRREHPVFLIGTSKSVAPLVWSFEIAHIEGRWRILRFRF